MQGPDEPCEGHGNSPTHLTDDRVVQKSGPMGQVTLRAGKALAGAPVASIPDLLGKPDGFEGKAVRVKGHVAAMCHHRRAWFAVAGEDKSGRLLRVIASPAFLVPPGSIGRTVTVEGTVDAIEMSPGKARHLQKEHKLGLPTDATAPVRQVVLRATGAEFG